MDSVVVRCLYTASFSLGAAGKDLGGCGGGVVPHAGHHESHERSTEFRCLSPHTNTPSHCIPHSAPLTLAPYPLTLAPIPFCTPHTSTIPPYTSTYPLTLAPYPLTLAPPHTSTISPHTSTHSHCTPSTLGLSAYYSLFSLPPTPLPHPPTHTHTHQKALLGVNQNW